jgi:hypothetical protein
MKQQSNGVPENLLPHEVDPDRSAYKDQNRPLRLGVAPLGECHAGILRPNNPHFNAA